MDLPQLAYISPLPPVDHLGWSALAGHSGVYYLTQQQRNHLDIWANELNPQHNSGHDPHTLEGNHYFTERDTPSIRAEPIVYVIYSLKKAAYLWFGNPAAG